MSSTVLGPDQEINCFLGADKGLHCQRVCESVNNLRNISFSVFSLTPFKEMKAFPGSPQLPHPNVVVTKQQDPHPQEHSVYTACSCPALIGLLRTQHRCSELCQEMAPPSTADSSPPTPEPLSVLKVCSPGLSSQSCILSLSLPMPTEAPK